MEQSNETKTSSAETILRVATEMFAQHGYHGTSIREIARTAGVNVAAISYHFGGKDGLYRAVFRSEFFEEMELFDPVLHNITDERLRDPHQIYLILEGIYGSLVDFTVQNPEKQRLWFYRWLEFSNHSGEVDEEFSFPIYKTIADFLERAKQLGTVQPRRDVRFLVVSVTWILFGYFYGRQPVFEPGSHLPPTDPNMIQKFKAFIMDYLVYNLNLPLKPEGGPDGAL